jgi:Fic family protein
MFDEGWELIEGEAAHAIETLNYLNQVNVIQALVLLWTYHDKPDAGGCKRPIGCWFLGELHRTGTLFLLTKPGHFREIEVSVTKPDGEVVHQPPSIEELKAHTEDFEKTLGAMWEGASPIQVAAYALWRINWIHPFRNGNGRSARAFAYACLCLKVGFQLPGRVTVIDLIMESKPAFEAALRQADESNKATGTPDLQQMENYLSGLLEKQLASVLEQQPPATGG